MVISGRIRQTFDCQQLHRHWVIGSHLLLGLPNQKSGLRNQCGVSLLHCDRSLPIGNAREAQSEHQADGKAATDDIAPACRRLPALPYKHLRLLGRHRGARGPRGDPAFFLLKAAEAVRPCTSATPPKADVNSPLGFRRFVPWRFSDAGYRSAWLDRRCRRPKTCT